VCYSALLFASTGHPTKSVVLLDGLQRPTCGSCSLTNNSAKTPMLHVARPHLPSESETAALLCLKGLLHRDGAVTEMCINCVVDWAVLRPQFDPALSLKSKCLSPTDSTSSAASMLTGTLDETISRTYLCGPRRLSYCQPVSKLRL
jgi:hypothetical protein